jgi:Crp-like helix-turn-helix domain
MTKELIANLLGIRRESVTDCALKLQYAGLIQYARGYITVLDCAGLEKRSCECYGVARIDGYQQDVAHVRARLDDSRLAAFRILSWPCSTAALGLQPDADRNCIERRIATPFCHSRVTAPQPFG